MIIGEKFESEFDNYEEDNYDYLFKRKPKGVRQQKRTVRKENNQQKRHDRKTHGKGLLGKKKLPILGNFGMFDKNKKQKAVPITVSGPEPSHELPESSEAPLLPTTAGSDSGPELQIPASALPPAPSAERVRPAISSSAVEEPASDTPLSASDTPGATGKLNPVTTTTGKIASPASQQTPAADKDIGKNGNKKEALFSPLVGFACLGVVLILAGYAVFKSQQKSLVSLKGNA
jgi:hypothetical protein